MVSQNYRVCWNCRGLLSYDGISTQRETDKHIKDCNSNPLLSENHFDNYVCDWKDFKAITQIKKFIKEHLIMILKKKGDLLSMGFTHEFIESLLVLSRCKVIVLVNDKNIVSEIGKDNSKNTESSPVDNSLIAQKEGVIQEAGTLEDSANVVKEAKDQNNEIDFFNKKLLKEDEISKLTTHCKHHTNGNLKRLECKLCGYRSNSCPLMLRHLRSHGKDGKKFVCNSCNFTTVFQTKWNRHGCKNKEKGLVCQICQELFKSKALLNHHITTQHTDGGEVVPRNRKVFQCNECPYVGRDMVSLTDHRRKHTGDYLICDQPDCNFKTPYKRSLMQHLRQKHATEKTQVCHVCGFNTKHTTSLRKHMKLHEQVKQLKCAQCSYSCYSAHVLVLHTKIKHLKEKRYSCSECSFKTGYSVTLKNHLARHEQMRIEDPEGKQLRRKRKAKQYMCPTCSGVFDTLGMMKKHAKKCSLPFIVDKNSFPGVGNVCDLFEKKELYLDSQVEDLSAEVYSITRNIMDANSGGKNSFSAIVGDNLDPTLMGQERYCQKETEGVTCKGRNPMLAETSRTLAAERNSPLLEESLFNLMSDFPRPPNPNRCQSANALMFASLSPHLVDRPLTPDFFFSENLANTFFQSLSRNMDHDSLATTSNF